MKALQQLGRLALLYLVGSLVGVLAPIWLLAAALYFFLRRQGARMWLRRCLSLLLVPKGEHHAHKVF